MSDGAFAWSGPGKGKSSKSGDSGLPKHIQRMDNPNEVAEVKASLSTNDSGLPWGGNPSEKDKAYMSGLPKNKGSMVSKTGERTMSNDSLPQDCKAAHCGYDMTIKSKSIMTGMKKSK
jgi:hypothetical protein